MNSKNTGKLTTEIQELAKKYCWANPSIIVSFEDGKLQTSLETDTGTIIRDLSKKTSRNERTIRYKFFGSLDSSLNKIKEKLEENILNQRCPDIVCLCGSHRLLEQFQEVNLEETLAGNIVLSIGEKPGFNATKKQEKLLVWLHKKKIDMADEVVIIRLDGHIGESTAEEEKYALEERKPVRYVDYKTEYYTNPGEEFDPYGRSEKRIVRS